MAEQFRTTVSLVFWTETPDQSEQVTAGITSMVPVDDQAATLAIIEYVAAGRPAPAPALEPPETP